MATFLNIEQDGYYFTVHNNDKMVADETWTIERVAAFMALHHTLNVKATRYVKGLTFRTAVAAIIYTLTCDPESSKDINKITNWLVAQLCEMYDDDSRQGLLGRPLNLILDDLTKMVEDHIKDVTQPTEVFGKVVPAEPFFSRPSKEEYDAVLEREKRQEQAYWNRFTEELNNGTAIKRKILVRDGHETLTAIIVGITPKSIVCDLFNEYNQKVESSKRIPKNSTRLIIESYC